MHPFPPSGVDFQRHLLMSDEEIIAAHVLDGQAVEYARAMVIAVRNYEPPSGPNLDVQKFLAGHVDCRV